MPRIREIEKETRHDILAFLTAVAENVGDESKYIHLGLTSSDVKDTALGVMMKQTVSSSRGLVLSRSNSLKPYSLQISLDNSLHCLSRLYTFEIFLLYLVLPNL